MALSRTIWNLIAVLCALVGASAVVLAGLAVFQRPAAWFMAWFELLVVGAAVVGVLMARGRFREGPAIGLLCIAGTVVVASLLGYLSAGRTIMGMNLTGVLLARCFAGAVLCACAGADVLMREPRQSVPLLLRGLAAGVPVLIVGGLLSQPGVTGAISNFHPLVQFALWVMTGVVLTVLVCASAHWLIRAFVVGVEKADRLGVQQPKPG